MIRELTVAEYMEMVGSEGLLIKSMAGQIMTADAVGSQYKSLTTKEEEENEDEDDEDDMERDDDELGEEEGEEDEEDEDDDRTTFELTICTSDVDRIRDILNPLGMETKSFARNPLFLYEHGTSEAGRLTNPDHVLGRINSVTMNEKSVTAMAQYMPRRGNEIVPRILDMERKGLIPGNSIGWRPLAGIRVDDTTGIRTVDKWELIEVSKVLVPVNGRATTKQYGA